MSPTFQQLLVASTLFAAPLELFAQPVADDLTRQIDWVPQRSSSANPNLDRNGDSRSIEVGGELVLADLTGPGVINHMWSTIATDDVFHGRSLILKVYYDGASYPAVQVPLGDFFGVGHGAAADYHSAVTAVSSLGRARSCYWKMPFHKNAKVVISNDGTFRVNSFYFYLDWEKHESLPDDTVYFHAQYNQEQATGPDDFELLNTTGRGHYVGTVWSCQMTEQGWFGEGDDRFYIDGEPEPSLRGTGTEDYFGDAWGFRQFATPNFGVSLWEGYMPGDRCTAYRWHLTDPVPFRKSLKVTMETRGSIYSKGMQFHGQFLPRQDFVSAVAYWYQWPAVELKEELPPAKDRVAPYQFLKTTDLDISAKPSIGLMKSKEAVNYLCSVPDAEFTVKFRVPENGTYQINPIMNYGGIGGVYQPSLNGEEIGGPIDFSAKGAFDWVWTRLDLHELKKEKTYTLRFKGQGKSPHVRTSLGNVYGLGIAQIALLRLEDLPGYQKTLQEVRAGRIKAD